MRIECSPITRKSNFAISAAIGLLAIWMCAAEARDDRYTLKVDARPMSEGKIELDINTNIPGTVEVMANIGLRNQKGSDLYVGTDNERVLLPHGAGKATFDVSRLPRGKYEADIGFYPNWGFKDAVSRASGVTHDIEVKKPIEFVIQNVVSAAEQIGLQQKQKWVMDHALPESRWRPSAWKKRFGSFEQIPVSEETWDPSIVKDYYFRSVDMRVRVNAPRGQIMGFEMGRGSDMHREPDFERNPISPTEMAAFEPVVEDGVKRNLKDPDSAEFGAMFGNLTGETSAIICGSVNAKNGFGGYAGNRSFVSLLSLGESGSVRGASAITVFADRGMGFRKLWKECQ